MVLHGNSCRNTENGSINMKVNLIEKYDVARLIFNISDTGMGMPIEKINESKSWFYEMINRIDKLLARLIKKKKERERAQIDKI